MPSITLSHLSYVLPEGRALFADLDLSFGSERTGLVGRNGTGKTTLLRLISGEIAPQAGSVASGGTIAVLRQMVDVDPVLTIADLFDARAGLALLARAEAGTAGADELAEADWTLEARIAAALAETGLEATPNTLLAVLSGGQRTRAALAALTFADPDFLLLDEPTNNLDAEGRAAVASLLARWRKGAIVVSHDRTLLESMDAIVELTGLGATRYGGNYSAYRAQKHAELAAARHDLADAEKRAGEVARDAQAAAERQARRDKGGRRFAAKGGTPRILLGAIKQRAEETGAAGRRLAERQQAEAGEAVAVARGRLEVIEPLSVTLPPTGLAANRVVLTLEEVTVGHHRDHPVIERLNLTVTGPERVAITGPNGAGKSTLLQLVTGALLPWQGHVRVIEGAALLDQRVALLAPALSIRDNFRLLHRDADENACRAALARFRFRADAALQSVGSLSGGERLRAGLACVLGIAPPPLLILDEPTNHLDLDAIAAVEAGLSAYDGALLVVSHDAAFLDAIGITRRVALAPCCSSGTPPPRSG